MSNIEKELATATKIKRKAKEDDQAYYGRLREAAAKLPDSAEDDKAGTGWYALSEQAQEWVNDCTDNMKVGKAFPTFPDAEKSEEPGEEADAGDAEEAAPDEETAEGSEEDQTEAEDEGDGESPENEDEDMADDETNTGTKKVAKKAAKKTVKKAAKKVAKKETKTAAKKAAKPKAAAKSNGAKPDALSGRRRSKFPDDAKITVLTKENPCREGSMAHKKFSLFKTGMTVGDYLALGEKATWPDERVGAAHEIIAQVAKKTIKVG